MSRFPFGQSDEPIPGYRPPMLYNIVYCSTATAGVDAAAVDDIIAYARRHNPAHGITGLLVFGGTTFAIYTPICARIRGTNRWCCSARMRKFANACFPTGTWNWSRRRRFATCSRMRSTQRKMRAIRERCARCSSNSMAGRCTPWDSLTPEADTGHRHPARHAWRVDGKERHTYRLSKLSCAALPSFDRSSSGLGNVSCTFCDANCANLLAATYRFWLKYCFASGIRSNTV